VWSTETRRNVGPGIVVVAIWSTLEPWELIRSEQLLDRMIWSNEGVGRSGCTV